MAKITIETMTFMFRQYNEGEYYTADEYGTWRTGMNRGELTVFLWPKGGDYYEAPEHIRPQLVAQIRREGQRVFDRFMARQIRCRMILIDDDWPGYVVSSKEELPDMSVVGYEKHKIIRKALQIRVPNERVQEGADVTDLVVAEAKRLQAIRDKENEDREATFRKAKETGEWQVLDTWMAGCNDPDEECPLDTCTRYALPDGSTRIVRQHCW
jgi:hypothetical protein